MPAMCEEPTGLFMGMGITAGLYAFVEGNAMSILDTINAPQDLKNLSEEELQTLAAELRVFLINNLSKTGGHLASNLGVVELTLALHYVFNAPSDKLLWDVGHQSYVHKILTGRKEQFHTLRQFGGLSGFPKTAESPYDIFNTGHSSTSVSAALGIARARDLDGAHYDVIPIFGDGALTGGMLYEALNDAGRSKTKLILILNDNAMSISRNVGAISKHLRNLRAKPGYFKSKRVVEHALYKLPAGGKTLVRLIRNTKRIMRNLVLPTTLFEDLGFDYLGPIDGHDLHKLISVLQIARTSKKSVLIHVLTKKGKGYLPAETNPQNYHGVSKFEIESGLPTDAGKPDYSYIFGAALTRLAEDNGKIVAITGAMPVGTGLLEFQKRFRERFFDVGIAEQHAVTLAAGLAAAGYTPVVPLYSSFLQRAFDQALHDVCLQNLHVVFPVDRAGVVGADGETHHGIYDIAFLSAMPNMSILSPANFGELEQMLDYAVNQHNGPIAIRYPRGHTQGNPMNTSFTFGAAKRIREGSDAALITTGRMLQTTLESAGLLDAQNIRAAVLELPTIQPLDTASILDCTNGAPLVATIEDHVLTGGIGTTVAAVLAEHGVQSKLMRFAFPDTPIPHGTVAELDRLYGLDAGSIAKTIKEFFHGR